MPEPRLFFLDHNPPELPLGYRFLVADPDRAVEVAPGIRIFLSGTGDCTLPDGTVGRGAMVAVWDDREPAAAVEWGIADELSGYEKVRGCGDGGNDDGEKLARMLLPDYLKAYGRGAAWLVRRDLGEWKRVPDA